MNKQIKIKRFDTTPLCNLVATSTPYICVIVKNLTMSKIEKEKISSAFRHLTISQLPCHICDFGLREVPLLKLIKVINTFIINFLIIFVLTIWSGKRIFNI